MGNMRPHHRNSVTPLCDGRLMDIEEVPGAPTELLEAELVAHAAWEAVGMAKMLVVLAEFDRRRGFESWGCRSTTHWLNWKCGLGYIAAAERLRVAHALAELTVIGAAFRAGELSWSKVRALTRAATPAIEQGLCDIARHCTASQLEKLCRGVRRVTAEQAERQYAERSFGWRVDDHGATVITVRLPAERAAAVISAVRAATTPTKGVLFAEAAADAFCALVAQQASVRTEVIVHLDADHATAAVEDGPPLAAEIADQVACDAAVTVTAARSPITAIASAAMATAPAAAGGVEHRRRAPSRRLRRQLARRHPSCQFPGCHHSGPLELHHLTPVHRGGPTTAANLARICGFHHRLIHLRHLRLAMGSDRVLGVTTADGQPVDRPIPEVRFIPPKVADPSRIGGAWEGDHLRVNDCIDGLGLHSTSMELAMAT